MSSSAAHPSALALHGFHLAALPAEEAARVQTHVATCAKCRQDLDALAADHRHFDRVVFPRTSDAIAGRRRPWRWALPGAALATAAAAVMLWMARPSPVYQDVASKGTSAPLTLIASRGDRLITVEDGGSALHPGDGVRFVLRPEGLPYAIVASVDGAGQASIYHPYEGGASAALPASARFEVPGSITLDESPGPERVFVLFSRRPIPAAEVRAALVELGRLGPSAIRGAQRLAIPCEQQASVLFEKSR